MTNRTAFFRELAALSVKDKYLLIDVESSPNEAYVWGKYEQNVVGDFLRERQIISFSWKWLGEKETHVRSLRMYPGYKADRRDNRALVADLHKLISGADYVIAHNLNAFDAKMINTEFIVHGLKPPKRYRTLDTLLMARRYFSFNSNKLDDLGKRLKVGRKAQTGGFSLWVGCLNGDLKSWRKMEQYNKQDVILLEKVYLKLKPWADRPALKRLKK